jgi:hypothetical protein
MIATLDIVRSCVLETAPLGANSVRIKKLEDELEAAKGKDPETAKEP